MARRITRIYHRILVFLHLSPLSLARKCGLAFVLAVGLVLILALFIPYVWMNQLSKNAFIFAGRAQYENLLMNHLQTETGTKSNFPPLTRAGKQPDANEPPGILWIYYKGDKQPDFEQLTKNQYRMIKKLVKQNQDDEVTFVDHNGITYSDYVKICRAQQSCLECHNEHGGITPFKSKELIGAAVISRPANELNLTETKLGNMIWIIFAGLIAATGAIVAFYWITQRVIIRPVRQLRAMANNVAEGNLDIRSSINTQDEYEKLAEAFNHMLDNIQDMQQKLRGANKQLDEKIAELSTRNIELFKANKIKGEFLANMSHEFRTPLNSILGFAEILKEKSGGPDKEKNIRYAENIVTAGKSLLNMINDLLDLAKTEAGKMKLHIEKGTVRQLTGEISSVFSVMTQNKKIKVRVTLDDEIPVLNTDLGKVRQVLYNFMSNAVKFTGEKGRIEIKATMLDERMLRIAVIDTGCGIAEKDQEKIFEKFRQGDGSLTRESAGTGLGLALSKELANLLAGSVGLESELDKGSMFWLDIPVTISAPEDEESQQ